MANCCDILLQGYADFILRANAAGPASPRISLDAGCHGSCVLCADGGQRGNSSLFAVAHCPAVISAPETPGPADTGPQREQWTATPSDCFLQGPELHSVHTINLWLTEQDILVTSLIITSSRHTHNRH